MSTTSPRQKLGAENPAFWWMIWIAILTGLCAIYWIESRKPPSAPDPQLVVNVVAIVPLFVSIVIRWLVLPRFTERLRAFPMFIVGLGLAEGSGILGIYLGGPYRDHFAVLGVLGVVQYMPYLLRFGAAPSVR